VRAASLPSLFGPRNKLIALEDVEVATYGGCRETEGGGQLIHGHLVPSLHQL